MLVVAVTAPYAAIEIMMYIPTLPLPTASSEPSPKTRYMKVGSPTTKNMPIRSRS